MSKIQRKPILQSRINQKEFGDVGGISVEKKITELVDFNPTRLVKKGKLAPFVDMAALPTNGKCISEIGEREFTGSGSKFKNGDTLFARITPCLENGKTAKVFGLPEGVAGCGSTEFIVMAAKEPEFDEEYVYYFARLPEFRAFAQARMEGTSGRQRVSWQALTDFSFNFPDKKIRKKVGNILKELDDKIELNRQINQTLEQMAQAIFKSWFVDFDPVRAKMEGRDTGLPAHIADLFPNELEESELGPIPKGWCIKSLDEIANYLNGLAMQKFPVENESEILPVIKIAQLKKGDTVGADIASSNIKLEYIVEDGDVLFSWSGSLEVDIWCGGRGALNQHLFKVTSDDYSKWFYLYWTKYHLEKFQAIAAGKAVTMGHIQRKHLTEAKCIVPDEKALQGLGTYVSNLIEEQINRRLEMRTLSNFRDSLLPKLLSGEMLLDEVI